MTLPPDLTALINSLDLVDQSVRRLTDPLTEAQFNWQPHGGRGWSIAQCLDHLRAGSAIYLRPLIAAADTARANGLRRDGPLRAGGLLSRWFVSMMGPKPRLKLKAPGKIAPGSRFEKAATVAAFLATQVEVRDYVLKTADLDLNAVRFANPLVRGIRFTAATGLLVLEAHNRRHVWQAEQVPLADGFPPS
jgi:hypothetical protein